MFCNNCGVKLDNENRFCDKCQVSIKSSETQQKTSENESASPLALIKKRYIIIAVAVLAVLACILTGYFIYSSNAKKLYYGEFEIVEAASMKIYAISENNYSVKASGKINNNTDKNYAYAQITFKIYDKDKNLLGTSTDNIIKWSNSSAWNFNTTGVITEGIPYSIEFDSIITY